MLDKNKIIKNLLVFTLFLTAIINHVFGIPKLATLFTYIFLLPILFNEVKYKKYFYFFSPFVFIFLSGLIFTPGHNTSHIFRDFFYFINPLFFMFFGYLFAMKINIRDFNRLVIILGTLLSVIFIFQTLYHFGTGFLNNQASVRGEIGVGNPVSIFALILVLFGKDYEDMNFINESKLRNIIIFINFLALVMFGSRTYFGVFLIGIFSFLIPYFKRNLVKYMTLFAVLIVITIILLTAFKGNFFVDKLLDSVSEVSSADDIDMESLYANYRGYEAAMALNTYLNANTLQKVIGLGFGQLIDLKMYIELGGSEWRYIPVLHNGYAYLLVKTGIVGIVLFILFYIKVIKKAISSVIKTNNYFLPVVCIAIITSTYFAQAIISGFYNMQFESFLTIFGAYMFYMIKTNDLSFIDEN